jgi:hypothetical protein
VPRTNDHEESIRKFADDFRGQVERLRPHVRGGDRPPYTDKINPSDLRDRLVAEAVAADFDRRGLHEQAALTRQRAASQATRSVPRGFVP